MSMRSLGGRATKATIGLLVTATAVGITATLSGHTDDPKEADAVPAYVGPGYRSGVDGAQPPIGFPAEGVELLSWLTVSEFPGSGGGANDCWGYTSPSGAEYAIICLAATTGFVDLSDPTVPVVVGTIPSPNCTWHDVKTYDEYAYVVSECGAGIQVIDLTAIDEGTVTLVSRGDQRRRRLAQRRDRHRQRLPLPLRRLGQRLPHL